MVPGDPTVNPLDIIVGCPWIGRWQGTGDLFALLLRAAHERHPRATVRLAERVEVEA